MSFRPNRLSSFPRKREASSVKETDADFYLNTKALLDKASADRDEFALRRAAIRVDGARFNDLTDDQQAELLMLYAAALSATGALAP